LPILVSADRARILLNRLQERLWVKPLSVCVLSILLVFAAKLADGTPLMQLVPALKQEAIETLLSIIAGSMLVIATFSVASMVSAYASASGTATPRSFPLVIADDASQNALSTFVGAFIFSIVALTAVMNGYFKTAALFVTFVLTVIVFGVVIVTFVRWVDRIARLGRLGSTINKVEAATGKALKRRRDAKTLCGVPVRSGARGPALFAESVGYIQYIDMAALQAWAEENQLRLEIAALPGAFITPDRAVAYIKGRPNEQAALNCEQVIQSFQIGNSRLFDDDPRFGLVVLSEIAGRALSPGINDPGTAIDIIGALLRLFILWGGPSKADDQKSPVHDRVEVPELSAQDMFDDAFTAIARDGAGVVEVSIRLQKALRTLKALGEPEVRDAAERHGKLALKRAQIAMSLEEDLEAVRNAAS